MGRQEVFLRLTGLDHECKIEILELESSVVVVTILKIRMQSVLLDYPCKNPTAI